MNNLFYSTISTTFKAYDVCFAYPCEGGTDTLDGLYNWESRDVNNKLFIISSFDEASKIVNNRKLLKLYI